MKSHSTLLQLPPIPAPSVQGSVTPSPTQMKQLAMGKGSRVGDSKEQCPEHHGGFSTAAFCPACSKARGLPLMGPGGAAQPRAPQGGPKPAGDDTSSTPPLSSSCVGRARSQTRTRNEKIQTQPWPSLKGAGGSVSPPCCPAFHARPLEPSFMGREGSKGPNCSHMVNGPICCV